MRTLRYLGVVNTTELVGEDADKFLDVVKSMPDDIGPQEHRYLSSYGIPLNVWRTWKREDVIDYLWKLGRDEYIKIKTRNIHDKALRLNVIKELLRKTRKNPKLVHNIDPLIAETLLDYFRRFGKCSKDDKGNYCYSKMSINEYTIQAKYANGEEYFVVTKEL